jgi:agmatine deiminase
MTNIEGKPFRIVELPMPAPMIYEDRRLPASYANILIANGVVLIPTLQDNYDAVRSTFSSVNFRTDR